MIGRRFLARIAGGKSAADIQRHDLHAGQDDGALGDFNRLGMTMLLGFAVSYGFILPINAPQNMVCLGTETFTARQFARVGIPVTVIGYLSMLGFALTYWKWLGWM